MALGGIDYYRLETQENGSYVGSLASAHRQGRRHAFSQSRNRSTCSQRCSPSLELSVRGYRRLRNQRECCIYFDDLSVAMVQ
jgi:hypothetical protein